MLRGQFASEFRGEPVSLRRDFVNRKVTKYPTRRGDMLYLPPGALQSLLRDPELPAVIPEGEFNTLALWRAPNRCCKSASVSAIGRAPVFN